MEDWEKRRIKREIKHKVTMLRFAIYGYFAGLRRNKFYFSLVSLFIVVAFLTSAYSSVIVTAFVKVQNFTQNDTEVTRGVELYKYSSETNDSTDSKSDFDSNTYSSGSFESGTDDLASYVDLSDDYLELNHFGDVVPSTNNIDWWDDDSDSTTKYNWRYRKCFEVDHTASGATTVDEYQIYLDIDTASLVSSGYMLSDGADIRFTDSNGNLLDFYIADDMNSTSTRIWVKVNQIMAGSTKDICMYYGYVPYLNNPIPANLPITASNREDTFTYSTAKDIYYIVADSANGGTTDFVSYSDSNDVTIGTYSGTLNAGTTATYPATSTTFTQTSAISTTAPINGSYDSLNGGDNLVPASASGTSFVYRMDRGTNEFSMISPWCSANVTVRNGSGNLVSNGSFTISQGGYHNLTTNNTSANGIPNNSSVIIEVSNGCPILVTHHTTSSGDSLIMYPASTEWYGVGSGRLEIAAIQNSTSITIYKSNGTSTSITLDRGDEYEINDTGSQGSEVAHRVVADKPIGVHGLADGDGTESETFLPVSEMGYRYYIPFDMQYIAVATKEGVSTTVSLYNDGTSCGTGTADSSYTVTPSSNYPGKVYFGSTSNGTNISAGACVVSTNPIALYAEDSDDEDETNLWNYKQNRQFIYQEPTTSTGATQSGVWDLGSTTNEWTKRIPITVTNNSSTQIDEYQINLTLDSLSDLFTYAQTDGGDIRVAGSDGDGTDNIDYWLESFDTTGTAGNLWFKTPTIAGSSSETVYLYFRAIDSFDITTLDPTMWLDAMDVDGDGVYGDNPANGALATWDDKSGNNNDASQSTAADRPSLSDYAVQFRGDAGETTTGEYYSIPNISGQSFVMVLDNVQDGTGTGTYNGVHGLFGQPDDGNGNYIYMFISTDELGYTISFDGTTSEQGYFALNGDNTLTGPGENIGSSNFPSSQTILYSQYVNSQTGWNQMGSFDWTSGNNLFRAYLDMKEVVVFSDTLTSTERGNIEDYLADKWGTSRASTSLSTTGNLQGVFTTTSVKPNYYLVDSLVTSSTLRIISFADNNSVSDGTTTRVLDEGDIDTLPFNNGVQNDDNFSVLGPIQADFSLDTTDSAIPIAYAGTEFVQMVTRGSDSFSIYAPFGDASVTIYESGSTGYTSLTSATVSSGTVSTINQDITNNRAFKITSDVPILAFHRANTQDSMVLYPTHLAYEQDSGSYELFGVGTQSLTIAASNDGTNVTIFRSDGTSTSTVLGTSNNFVYRQGGLGAQGDSIAFHIVADGPIGANSYADADGVESYIFVSQKEFSEEYYLSSSAQYFSIVAKDSSVTCKVYDDTGVEVTTGPGTMDNVPPQTGGTNAMPYPNIIHIGGNDTSDPAFFSAGYKLSCNEPVFAFYERDDGSGISDETNWLTWPQVRQYTYPAPIVSDPDLQNSEGLYYESGYDSAGAGSDPEAYIELVYDLSSETYGDDTYYRNLDWLEVSNNRSSRNSVNQLGYEIAYGDSSPTCSTASYSSFVAQTPTTISSSDDTSSPHVTFTTSEKEIVIPDEYSDHDCFKVRVYFRTGDEAFAPRLNRIDLNYTVPSLLEDQFNDPNVAIPGNTTSNDIRRRILKAKTDKANLLGSKAYLTYKDVSDGSVFSNADFEFLEINPQTTSTQFNFPPFPSTPPYVDASTTSSFDASNSLGVYFTHRRATGSAENIYMIFNVDILNSNGPFITREFRVEVGG